jgi:hypothetical protein
MDLTGVLNAAAMLAVILGAGLLGFYLGLLKGMMIRARTRIEAWHDVGLLTDDEADDLEDRALENIEKGQPVRILDTAQLGRNSNRARGIRISGERSESIGVVPGRRDPER